MRSNQKQSSIIAPSEFVKGMEKLAKLSGFDSQNAIVFSVLNGEIKELEKKIDEQYSQIKKLERTVDWIGNYIKEQTGLEPGKELTDSSDSSETDYVIHDPEKKIHKVKCVKKRSGNKKVKRK
jgi:hypothetical protein